MALSEKLSKLAQEKNVEQEEYLKPVRIKISEIEKKISELELLSNSLSLKSDKEKGNGYGMKEAKAKLAEQIKEKGEELDKLFSRQADPETQNALKILGIRNKEELLQSGLFSAESEVVEYNNTQNLKKEFDLSDQALKSKLETLGIILPEGNWSYQDVEDRIKDKLALLESDLIKEKIKTPEGRLAGLKEIVSDFEKNSPQVALSYDEKTNGYQLRIGQSGYGREISVIGERAIFKKWYDPEIIPKNASQLEKKYDSDLVKEAVKKTYENKINKSFEDFDRQTEGVYLLKDELEKVSPAEGVKVKEYLSEFSNLQNDFRQALSKKSEELKAKGIDFNPDYPPTYGDSYELLIKLATDKQLEILNHDLSDVAVFPPKYDYLKLQSFIADKKKHLEIFIEAIKNLNSEEDIKALDSGSGQDQQALLSKLRLDQYSGRFELYDFESTFVEKDRYYGNNISPQQKYLNDLKFKAKNFDQAKELINQKIDAFENLKEIVLNRIDLAVQAQFKRNELMTDMEKQGVGKDVGTLRSEIANMELQKSEAENMLIQLAKFEAELADEEITLNENIITINRIQVENEALHQEIVMREQEVIDKNDVLMKLESHKPFWGKATWINKIEKLKKELQVINEEIESKRREYRRSLPNETKLIKTNYNTDIDKRIKEFKNLKGKSGEVFEGLKSFASEIINRKMPESVLALYREYSNMEKELEK